MKIIKGDILDYLGDYTICIPTNGFVKTDGCAVMGRGLALQFKNKFPNIDKILGGKISKNGNVPNILSKKKFLVSFPVKVDYLEITTPEKLTCLQQKYYRSSANFGDRFPGWMCKADLKLIEKSAKLLSELYDENDFLPDLAMPKVGCGNGELKWKDVEPIIKKHLGDIVTIVDLR